VCLTAVNDWYSRYVLSWRLSDTLEGRFCLEALDEAFRLVEAKPGYPLLPVTFRGKAAEPRGSP
jgi:transposase InsO family protein